MPCTPEGVYALLGCHLSARRRAHSRRTARLAAELCRRFGLDPQPGVVAGLAHDVARELPDGQLLALAAQDGRGITAEQRRRPVLLHGRAGAALLRRRGLEGCDPEVYEAVADHVTGRPGMGPLARVVYVADFLEPGRGFMGPETRAGLLAMDLDAMVRAVLGRVSAYLAEGGVPVAEDALALYHELGEHADEQAQMG